MRRDLDLGRAGENRIIKILATIDVVAELNNDRSQRSYYDIVATLNGEQFTLEVKNDIYALRSGNIAIEIFNPKSGRASGLSITQANIWAHIVGDEIWLAKTDSLRSFIDSNKPFKYISSGGDDNATLLLYRLDFILPSVFRRADDVSPDELRQIILDALQD